MNKKGGKTKEKEHQKALRRALQNKKKRMNERTNDERTNADVA